MIGPEADLQVKFCTRFIFHSWYQNENTTSRYRTLKTNTCTYLHAIQSHVLRCSAIKCCMLLLWCLASRSNEMNEYRLRIINWLIAMGGKKEYEKDTDHLLWNKQKHDWGTQKFLLWMMNIVTAIMRFLCDYFVLVCPVISVNNL